MNNFKFIDLTHTLKSTIPTWDGSCGFMQETKIDYSDCTTEVKFCVQTLSMNAGIGTHIDAPSHCFEGSTDISQLSLEQLIVPAIKIDICHKADAQYQLSVDDIINFEKSYGAIPKNAFVIIYTSWDRFWQNPKQYINNHVFPSISKEAAEYLLTKEIVGLGIDALSPDLPQDNFPVHQLLLKNNKYLIENVAHAKELPASNFYTIALPLKIHDGMESPIRLIGVIPKIEEEGGK